MSIIHCFKTSPSYLDDTINNVLNTKDFQEFDPRKRTYIKINANYDKIWPGCNTSKWFLDSLFRNLKEHSFEDIVVIEGDLKLQPANHTIKVTGIERLLKQHEIPFLAIEELPRENEIPKILQNSQLISTPVLHTHTFAVISVATKNLYGLLPVYREKYHHILSEKLIELYKNIKVFSIVDGTVGLEGGSMRMGNPVKTDLIIAGWDTIGIDMVAAKIMGFTTNQIPYLKFAKEKGIMIDWDLVGDYTIEQLPKFNFNYEDSNLSKIDLWIRENFKFLFNYNGVFDKSFNKMRRAYLSSVYKKKIKEVSNGNWNEYQEVYNQRDNI